MTQNAWKKFSALNPKEQHIKVKPSKKTAKLFILFILLICVVLFIPSISNSIFFCQDCGSRKNVHEIRIPGLKILPAMYLSSKAEIEESPFYEDFYKQTGHEHNWKFSSKNYNWLCVGYNADGAGFPRNKIIVLYSYNDEFREYIQKKIKDGKYTKQQIIKLSKPENEKLAQELLDKFYAS